ncbi:hypothetical protein GGI20_004000 [Coemansia sp. BCRC 34301]|nr:hypothetical protein GGI20_004000 [Coemansia sp. BCRC 34301]
MHNIALAKRTHMENLDSFKRNIANAMRPGLLKDLAIALYVALFLRPECHGTRVATVQGQDDQDQRDPLVRRNGFEGMILQRLVGVSAGQRTRAVAALAGQAILDAAADEGVAVTYHQRATHYQAAGQSTYFIGAHYLMVAETIHTAAVIPDGIIGAEETVAIEIANVAAHQVAVEIALAAIAAIEHENQLVPPPAVEDAPLPALGGTSPLADEDAPPAVEDRPAQTLGVEDAPLLARVPRNILRVPRSGPSADTRSETLRRREKDA